MIGSDFSPRNSKMMTKQKEDKENLQISDNVLLSVRLAASCCKHLVDNKTILRCFLPRTNKPTIEVSFWSWYEFLNILDFPKSSVFLCLSAISNILLLYMY